MYLTQPLHRNAQQRANTIASIDGDRVFTHAEVLDRVARLAGGLHALGVARDDRVAILSMNSDRYYPFMHATAWADAVTVPVNTRWSAKEIAYSLVEAGVRVVAVDDAFVGLLAEVRALAPGLDTIIHVGDGEVPSGALSFEALIADSAPIPTRIAAVTSWPASTTPVAPPGSPRASC